MSFKAANFKILSKGETGVQLASLWEQVTEFTKNMFLPHQTDAITEAQSMLEPALHVWVFSLGSVSAVAAQISLPCITAHNCHFLISFQQP